MPNTIPCEICQANIPVQENGSSAICPNAVNHPAAAPVPVDVAPTQEPAPTENQPAPDAPVPDAAPTEPPAQEPEENDDSLLDEMSKPELKEIAANYNLEVGTFESRASIVERIRAARQAAKQPAAQ
jgi:hypothetical protein